MAEEDEDKVAPGLAQVLEGMSPSDVQTVLEELKLHDHYDMTYLIENVYETLRTRDDLMKAAEKCDTEANKRIHRKWKGMNNCQSFILYFQS